ncbi:CinA family protein [Terrimonas sp. NA20]|uniref:CinA family protein n=1 Tax=Terrimonas ginsenosidimutans TaxID=2908004 RepID=A0ABS9KMM5_9BACT|nr:CinA family protein [Terrimonas ginsenosidimutans]MCG2613554.1 CinA family protein [Terrimonas ginsenosidimutans]
MNIIPQVQAQVIRKGLLGKNKTIATAESVTSGLLQYAFSTIPDASQFFQGGVTAFNLAQKTRHLQVESIHAQAVNCVSEKVAKEMAIHCCKMFISDWGIGITGYASPVPESNNKCFAYFAIAFEGKIMVSGCLEPQNTEPTKIQEEYVLALLSTLQKLL